MGTLKRKTSQNGGSSNGNALKNTFFSEIMAFLKNYIIWKVCRFKKLSFLKLESLIQRATRIGIYYVQS